MTGNLGSTEYKNMLEIVVCVIISSLSIIKCWEFKLNGDEGVCQGRIGVNSNVFLRHWTRKVSTPDLIVTEFRMGCGQMDLATACVLHLLNCLVLDFKMGGLTE